MKELFIENLPYLLAVAVFAAITTWKKLEQRQEIIEKAIDSAFYIVENMKHQTDTKIDDKVAEGLGQLKQLLAARKVRSSKSINMQAEARFNELHGRHKSSK